MSESIFYSSQLPVYLNYRKSTLHVIFSLSLSLSITVWRTPTLRPFLLSNSSGNRWEFSSAFLRQVEEEEENEEINTHSKTIYIQRRKKKSTDCLFVIAKKKWKHVYARRCLAFVVDGLASRFVWLSIFLFRYAYRHSSRVKKHSLEEGEEDGRWRSKGGRLTGNDLLALF